MRLTHSSQDLRQRLTIHRRAADKKASQSEKRVAAKGAAPKKLPYTARRRAKKQESTRTKRASKSASVRWKERKVEERRHQLIEAEKELAVEQLPKK